MNTASTETLVSKRCVEHLLSDHREGEKIMNELESLLETPCPEHCWSPARAENFSRIARFFEEIVLAHMRKEEEVLFPALEAYLPRDVGPLAVLRGEHLELLHLFERLLAAGRLLSAGEGDAQVCAEFERVGRAIIQGFRDHVYKEDRVLFPMIGRFLTPERDAYLLEQMLRMGARATSQA